MAKDYFGAENVLLERWKNLRLFKDVMMFTVLCLVDEAENLLLEALVL